MDLPFDTHAMNVEQAREMVRDLPADTDPDTIEAIKAHERKHPKTKGGRKGILNALEERKGELSSPDPEPGLDRAPLVVEEAFPPEPEPVEDEPEPEPEPEQWGIGQLAALGGDDNPFPPEDEQGPPPADTDPVAEMAAEIVEHVTPTFLRFLDESEAVEIALRPATPSPELAAAIEAGRLRGWPVSYGETILVTDGSGQQHEATVVRVETGVVAEIKDGVGTQVFVRYAKGGGPFTWEEAP